MEAGEYMVNDSGRSDEDLVELVTSQMEKYCIGGQAGLDYNIKQAVTDLDMEPNETSMGRKIPVSTITFNRKELADEFVLKTQEEMRVTHSVIVVPGEEYHQMGKYTRLLEKFAQQQRGQLDHRGTAPAYQPLAGNYAAAVRGEGGGAAAAVESRLEVVTLGQKAQSLKMQGMEDTIRDVESRLVAQVSQLVTKALGNHLEKAVAERMDARMSDGLRSVLAQANSEVDKQVQVATDRFSQKQSQQNQDMIAKLEERMTAALTAAMAAQTQQMTALMQSQAAGHGEGGLGLAKGDG
jgi:hypothetical protein